MPALVIAVVVATVAAMSISMASASSGVARAKQASFFDWPRARVVRATTIRISKASTRGS